MGFPPPPSLVECFLVAEVNEKSLYNVADDIVQNGSVWSIRESVDDDCVTSWDCFYFLQQICKNFCTII